MTVHVREVLARPKTWSRITGDWVQKTTVAVNFNSLIAPLGPLDFSQPSWEVNLNAGTMTVLPPNSASTEVQMTHPRVIQRTTGFDFIRNPFLLTMNLRDQDSGRPWDQVTWLGGTAKVVETSPSGVTLFDAHDACNLIRNLIPCEAHDLIFWDDEVEVMNGGRRQITATATWVQDANIELPPFSTSAGGDEFVVTVDVDWGVVVRVEKRYKGDVAAVHELGNISAV